MSTSAISGLGGIASAPLGSIFAANQASAKPQATAAPAAPAADDSQPILLIPSKPPLSAAVMAVLLGRQASSGGDAIGAYAGSQQPVDGAVAEKNSRAA